MKIKWEDKIIKVEINETEIWKEIKYGWEKIFFKEWSKNWDSFKIKWKWYKSKFWWKNWDLIYIIWKIKNREKFNKTLISIIISIILIITIILSKWIFYPIFKNNIHNRYSNKVNNDISWIRSITLEKNNSIENSLSKLNNIETDTAEWKELQSILWKILKLKSTYEPKIASWTLLLTNWFNYKNDADIYNSTENLNELNKNMNKFKTEYIKILKEHKISDEKLVKDFLDKLNDFFNKQETLVNKKIYINQLLLNKEEISENEIEIIFKDFQIKYNERLQSAKKYQEAINSNLYN